MHFILYFLSEIWVPSKTDIIKTCNTAKCTENYTTTFKQKQFDFYIEEYKFLILFICNFLCL